ncbi:MAG: WecB/TagA/CpsF family glycosyltransferase [Clostridiales bacterium]|nr:WecB/TagA/CpsF family glycosyltransferase [Clostridiales bacterium]
MRDNTNFTEISGLRIWARPFADSVRKAEEYLRGDKLSVVFTPNPEALYRARRDEAYFEALKAADLLVADGIGLVLASKLNKIKIRGRTPGCDLAQALLPYCAAGKLSVYILGAAPGVAEAACAKIKESCAGLKIAGCGDGYFDAEREKLIIQDISEKKPELLLVGLGMPKQELWLIKNREALAGVKLAIACGGTIDVLAGKAARAPLIFRKLGLEWLFRIARQPERLGRAAALPGFMLDALTDKLRGRAK